MLLLISIEIANIDNKIYAHFTGGSTKDIDNYRILFLLLPSRPVAGDNSTRLNFSILEKDKNADVNSIFAALTIKEKNSGTIVHQIPYKLYGSGDITFPYTFKNNTNYEATLQARISGDPKYESTPLMASFDITAVNPGAPIDFNELLNYYIIPISIIIALIGFLIIIGKRKQNQRQNKKQ